MGTSILPFLQNTNKHQVSNNCRVSIKHRGFFVKCTNKCQGPLLEVYCNRNRLHL